MSRDIISKEGQSSSRNYSPDKKVYMLRTLRSRESKKPPFPGYNTAHHSRVPAAATAATQAWVTKSFSNQCKEKQSGHTSGHTAEERQTDRYDWQSQLRSQGPLNHTKRTKASLNGLDKFVEPANMQNIDHSGPRQNLRSRMSNKKSNECSKEVAQHTTSQKPYGVIENVSLPTFVQDRQLWAVDRDKRVELISAISAEEQLTSNHALKRSMGQNSITKSFTQTPTWKDHVFGRNNAEKCSNKDIDSDSNMSTVKNTIRVLQPEIKGKQAIRGELSCGSAKLGYVLENLPKGVDEFTASQILNEIMVDGDEVHWDDIAGLENAKTTLKEAVVYPFLRPDLFVGLREPARGVLLFGPPGTGKTMLARAVATESNSTFFSISSSSLTSKFHGDSEKLVRALFAIAKELAPSVVFVDEIDSILAERSNNGEHEASRRMKTEFLIQWSTLASAAIGKEANEAPNTNGGNTNRVLILAATNLPWAIDAAARRRFVRRQYIPLPDAEVRLAHLKLLLRNQRHRLSDYDFEKLVIQTQGMLLSNY